MLTDVKIDPLKLTIFYTLTFEMVEGAALAEAIKQLENTKDNMTHALAMSMCANRLTREALDNDMIYLFDIYGNDNVMAYQTRLTKDSCSPD